MKSLAIPFLLLAAGCGTPANAPQAPVAPEAAAPVAPATAAAPAVGHCAFICMETPSREACGENVPKSECNPEGHAKHFKVPPCKEGVSYSFLEGPKCG
jgi:hypothetical protein